jgi:hypothetical protein
VQQGPFAPRALPRFCATTNPAATVSSSADFPGSPVIRPILLRRFLDGTRTASPVARHVLVTVLPLRPRRSNLPPQSDCDRPCCLRPKTGGSASGVSFLSRPPVSSLPLRPGDSLTLPKRALSVGFTRFVSSTDATQATRLLTPAPVGLAPTEHASLSWTHCLPKTPSALESSGAPLIAVVQSSDFSDGDDRTQLRPLDGSRFRSILPEGEVRP